MLAEQGFLLTHWELVRDLWVDALKSSPYMEAYELRNMALGTGSAMYRFFELHVLRPTSLAIERMEDVYDNDKNAELVREKTSESVRFCVSCRFSVFRRPRDFHALLWFPSPSFVSLYCSLHFGFTHFSLFRVRCCLRLDPFSAWPPSPFLFCPNKAEIRRFGDSTTLILVKYRLIDQSLNKQAPRPPESTSRVSGKTLDLSRQSAQMIRGTTISGRYPRPKQGLKRRAWSSRSEEIFFVSQVFRNALHLDRAIGIQNPTVPPM